MKTRICQVPCCGQTILEDANSTQTDKTFVVYEIWTRSRVVTLKAGISIDAVLDRTEPEPVEGMILANWHAVEIPGKTNG